MTFADAAEEVLKRHSKGAPLNYREITELAIEHELLTPGGQTPEASMNVAIRQDIKRRDLTGQDQRFRAHGRGMYSLALADDPLGGAVERKNAEVRRQLRERLAELDPQQFEELIGELLSALGYEDVEVTKYVGDGGIDVRGTLTIGGVTRVQTAIQVKRWTKNVSGRTVRELRGALGPHERGLVITLSGFTRDASKDASSATRVPISLVDGDRLITLLMDHDIGVTRRRVTVYEIDEEAFAVEEPPEGKEGAVPPQYDTRARSMWPLPGGRRSWRDSLDEMLHFVATTAPTMSEAVNWVIDHFEAVSSQKVARGYWQVPKSFGLMHSDGEQLVLSAKGTEYLRTSASDLLLQAAKANVLGFREILDYLAETPQTAEELLAQLEQDLRVGWKTTHQVAFRLGWLENLGAVAQRRDTWALTGRRAVPPVAGEDAPVAEQSDAVADHFDSLPDEVVKLFERLDERLLAMADVSRISRKQYIGYRIGKDTVCSVIPQRRRLKLVPPPLDPAGFDHPLTRDLSAVGHWGVGDLEITYQSEEDLDQIISWISRAVDQAGN